MEKAKLQALHDSLKAGAPRGRVGGLGAGAQRGGVAASASDSPLYRHFVKEGAVLVEAMVGVPKHEGTRMTFDEDGEAPPAPAPAAAAGTAEPEEAEEGGGVAGSGFTLKHMKRAVEAFLGAAKGGRAREKWVRSAALEAAEEAGLAEAAELYSKALRKLLKKGRVREEEGGHLVACGAAQEGGAAQRKRARSGSEAK
jgi:hypothetical protein